MHRGNRQSDRRVNKRLLILSTHSTNCIQSHLSRGDPKDPNTVKTILSLLRIAWVALSAVVIMAASPRKPPNLDHALAYLIVTSNHNPTTIPLPSSQSLTYVAPVGELPNTHIYAVHDAAGPIKRDAIGTDILSFAKRVEGIKGVEIMQQPKQRAKRDDL